MNIMFQLLMVIYDLRIFFSDYDKIITNNKSQKKEDLYAILKKTQIQKKQIKLLGTSILKLVKNWQNFLFQQMYFYLLMFSVVIYKPVIKSVD